MPDPKTPLIFAAALVASVAGGNAHADHSRIQSPEFDAQDLRAYVYCNSLAETRPLNYDEAVTCSIAIQRLKLAFVPGMSLEKYYRLPLADQASANLEGYGAFRKWLKAHTSTVQAIKDEIQSSRVTERN